MNKDIAQPDLPLILLASDEPRLAAFLHLALRQQSLTVEFAPGYREVERLAKIHERAIVLLEVSRYESVEAAVELALRIKHGNASRFVGYLADHMLRSSGLAGDAIFPRSAPHLAQALRDYFRSVV